MLESRKPEAMRFEHTDASELDDMSNLNLRAPMARTNLLRLQMLARGRGHVVNVTSLAGLFGDQGERCALRVPRVTRAENLGSFQAEVRARLRHGLRGGLHDRIDRWARVFAS